MARALVVVEGSHDIQFLIHMAAVLRRDGLSVPDLAALEQCGHLIFVPIGGGNLAAWAARLGPLGVPELHLYDRETPPETLARLAVVGAINQRPGCRAFLTSKRSLENYLHPSAIQAALEIELAFDDESPVSELLARHCHEHAPNDTPWEQLSRRAKKRFASHAKRWLNTRAVMHMTAELLAQRDARGEVLSWLETNDDLARG